MSGLLFYPTGDALLDELTEFSAARLPAIFGPVPVAVNGKPSLAEDWWVEARIAAGFVVPGFSASEDGLRAIYRWARNRNVETGMVALQPAETAADLLLHQVTQLTPMLFHAALRCAA